MLSSVKAFLFAIPGQPNRVEREVEISSVSTSFASAAAGFLNQWLHFDAVRLVTRGAACSLALRTQFGIFFSTGNGPSRTCLYDPVSHLQVDAGRISGCYVLEEAAGSRDATLEVAFARQGFALSVQPEGTSENRECLRKIRQAFAMECADGPHMISQGAGAWLDERMEQPSGVSEKMTHHAQRVATALANSQSVRIHYTSPGLTVQAAFRVSFADLDGTTLRLADRGQSHVAFLELGSDAINIDATDPRCVCVDVLEY